MKYNSIDFIQYPPIDKNFFTFEFILSPEVEQQFGEINKILTNRVRKATGGIIPKAEFATMKDTYFWKQFTYVTHDKKPDADRTITVTFRDFQATANGWDILETIRKSIYDNNFNLKSTGSGIIEGAKIGIWGGQVAEGTSAGVLLKNIKYTNIVFEEFKWDNYNSFNPRQEDAKSDTMVLNFSIKFRYATWEILQI